MIRGTPSTAMATLLAYGWLALSKHRPIQDGGGPADRLRPRPATTPRDKPLDLTGVILSHVSGLDASRHRRFVPYWA
jgi:hypothetical protein